MREVRVFFDRVARRYDRSFAPNAARTARDLAGLCCALPRGALVLDLGCGTGRAFPVWAEAGLRVVALDASRPMMAEAGRRASSAGVARVRADLYSRWPIGDAVVDLAVALHGVLAHPPWPPGEGPAAACAHVGRELRRVCREGARVALDLPEPAWARAHASPLGDDRYAFAVQDGASVIAWVPEPRVVLEALGLPELDLAPCETGVRASGTLSRLHPREALRGSSSAT